MGVRDFYKDYKVEIWKYSLFDCHKATSHINEMAKKGYYFVDLIVGVVPFAIYEKGKRKNIKYAVDVIKTDDKEEEAKIEQDYFDAGWKRVTGQEKDYLRDGLRFYSNTDVRAKSPHDDLGAMAVHLSEHADNNGKVGRRVAGGIIKALFGYIIAFGIEYDLDGWFYGLFTLGVCLMVHGLLQFGSCVFGSVRTSKQVKKYEAGISMKEQPILDSIRVGMEILIHIIPIILLIALAGCLDYIIITNGLDWKGILQIVIFNICPLVLMIYYPKAKVENSTWYDYALMGYNLILFALMLVN